MTVLRERPTTSASPPTQGRRTLLIGLFVVYLVLLAWVVLWKLEVPQIGGATRNVKLVPFVASDGDGASQPVEVLGNLLLFVPFGAYLGLLAPTWARWRLVALTVLASGAMECAQYALALGRTDTTDVVVNTAGGVVGLGLVGLAHLGLGARTLRLAPRVCAGGTALAVVLCGLFVAGPLRYGPPDVVCDQPGSCRVGHDLAR